MIRLRSYRCYSNAYERNTRNDYDRVHVASLSFYIKKKKKNNNAVGPYCPLRRMAVGRLSFRTPAHWCTAYPVTRLLALVRRTRTVESPENTARARARESTMRRRVIIIRRLQTNGKRVTTITNGDVINRSRMKVGAL